jgi:hypothetical protein
LFTVCSIFEKRKRQPTENDTKYNNMPKMPRNGGPCRLVGGSHAGKTGWYDTSNKKTARMIYVIVDDGDDKGGEVWARVMQHNVIDFAEDGSYAEAALKQHPDILKSMNKLCRALAECRLDAGNRLAVAHIFHDKLAAAAGRNTGCRATYRYVEWGYEEEVEES